SRVEAVELAVHRGASRVTGSVLASDGFFPYPDGVEVAARAGVRAIVQPGGSVKDSEAVAAADAAGIAMVFTGERHFRHCRKGVKRICYLSKRSSGQGCESPIGGKARERPT